MLQLSMQDLQARHHVPPAPLTFFHFLLFITLRLTCCGRGYGRLCGCCPVVRSPLAAMGRLPIGLGARGPGILRLVVPVKLRLHLGGWPRRLDFEGPWAELQTRPRHRGNVTYDKIHALCISSETQVFLWARPGPC